MESMEGEVVMIINIITQIVLNNMTNTFSQAFDISIMPILSDIGKVIFKVSVVGGIYLIIRQNAPKGIERIKYAAIGYVALNAMDLFINIVDNIGKNIAR